MPKMVYPPTKNSVALFSHHISATGPTMRMSLITEIWALLIQNVRPEQ